MIVYKGANNLSFSMLTAAMLHVKIRWPILPFLFNFFTDDLFGYLSWTDFLWAGSLWFMLGFWCRWVTIWPFLCPFQHGKLYFSSTANLCNGLIFEWTHIHTLFVIMQNLSLSVNDVLACCGFLCGAGCDGGYSLYAWRYFVHHGVVTEEVESGGFLVWIIILPALIWFILQRW